MIKINKWSELFENADTRKRQRLGWFLAPSGCDSRGYRKLMREGEQGIVAFGVFQALCQVMATFSKHTRETGEFRNSDGSGMELADLWETTRMKVADEWQIIGMLEKAGWISLLDQQSATYVPPTCHPSASSVPKNSGFVKGEGEGEGEGEDPLTPKGEWDGVFPKSCFSKSKTDQKKIRVLKSNQKMEFVGAWFGRKPETLWSVSEAKALMDLNPSRDEVKDLDAYRKTPNKWHRRDLLTLLNNWSGELDRARADQPTKSTQKPAEGPTGWQDAFRLIITTGPIPVQWGHVDSELQEEIKNKLNAEVTHARNER